MQKVSACYQFSLQLYCSRSQVRSLTVCCSTLTPNTFKLLYYRYEIEYEEAKRKTKETLHPLKLELAEINDYVRTVLKCCS